MAYSANFLGQSIDIGLYLGWGGYGSISKCAVIQGHTSFSILNYFAQNGGFEADQKAFIFKDASNNNVFALAYRDTSNYGYSTFIKYASTGITISDNDMPNYSAPWGGWVRIGSFDRSNIDMQALLDNSFAIYQAKSGLYPYWNGTTDHTFNEQVSLYGGVNCLIVPPGGFCDAGGTPTNYTGQTPIMPHGSANTNYLNANDVTDPSYTLGAIYSDLYNVLDIKDVYTVQDFTDDNSTAGGGYGGSYGYEGDDIGHPTPLSLSCVDTGFITLFSPLKSQLRDLASFCWSDGFINAIKKAWTQPMDSIIMLGIVPLDLSSKREATTSQIIIGNVSTGCQAYKISGDQYATVDFGDLDVPLNWSNCLDFEPFTQMQVYLPFIGFCPLKANDVIGGTVNLQYIVDLLSGDCVATLKITRFSNLVDNRYNSMVYQYRGNCLINLPISANDYSAFYKAITLGGINSIGRAAGGGGNGIGTAASALTGMVGSVTSAIMEGSDVQRSGNYSGSMAAIQQREPYIIISRPIQHKPASYNKFIGWPSYIEYKLSYLHGFTMVDTVIDNTVAATDAEKAMIEDLLKKGVFI